MDELFSRSAASSSALSVRYSTDGAVDVIRRCVAPHERCIIVDYISGMIYAKHDARDMYNVFYTAGACGRDDILVELFDMVRSIKLRARDEGTFVPCPRSASEYAESFLTGLMTFLCAPKTEEEARKRNVFKNKNKPWARIADEAREYISAILCARLMRLPGGRVIPIREIFLWRVAQTAAIKQDTVLLSIAHNALAPSARRKSQRDSGGDSGVVTTPEWRRPRLVVSSWH